MSVETIKLFVGIFVVCLTVVTLYYCARAIILSKSANDSFLSAVTGKERKKEMGNFWKQWQTTDSKIVRIIMEKQQPTYCVLRQELAGVRKNAVIFLAADISAIVYFLLILSKIS